MYETALDKWAQRLAMAMEEHEDDCPDADNELRHSAHLWVRTYPLTSTWQTVWYCKGSG